MLTGKICYRVVKLFLFLVSFLLLFLLLFCFSFLLILFASSNSSGGDSDNNFSTDGNNIYSCSCQPLHSGTRLRIVCTEHSGTCVKYRGIKIKIHIHTRTHKCICIHMCVCLCINLSIQRRHFATQRDSKHFFWQHLSHAQFAPSGPLCNVLLRQRRSAATAAAHEQK